MSKKSYLFIIFAFISVCCGCIQSQDYKFNHEVIHLKTYDRNESLRNVKLLEEIGIASVEFNQTPVLDAIDWLAERGQQTISYLDFNTHCNVCSTTNKTITLNMKNTTFLTVLDEICGQSKRSWGFNQNVLITLPNDYLRSSNDWILKAYYKRE